MQLSEDFLVEFFKACITTKNILELGLIHIKPQYLPTDAYKKVWKSISHVFELNGILPTIGILSEKLKNDDEALDLLLQVKNSRISDRKEIILNQLEVFIREMRFKELYKKIGLLYNEDKKDEAIALMAKESERIFMFSFRKGIYTRLFEQFDERQLARRRKDSEIDNTKIPTGIHPFDHYTRGGISIGTSALFLARSGVGKSTLLRWLGLHAARSGYRVVHFQCEGTEKEVEDAYDAAWTSIDLEDMEYGNIPDSKKIKIQRVRQDILNKKGEIFIIASEQFDNMTIEDCREHIIELEKIYGKIHLGIFDYLEKINVRGGRYKDEQGERKRREDVADKITNIATEFKMATATATQANDIQPQKWNNPEYVMTRSDIAEFKGALKPFSYFSTLNQTVDEYDAGVMRIFNDKFRKYKSGQTFRIFQSMKNSRFYDSQRTLTSFWDENSKQITK